MDLEALFALADEAKRETRIEAGDAESADDDDEDGLGRATYSVCPDGDIHACFGQRCPHVRINHDQCYVCSISGRVVDVHQARESDPGWTGRSTGSANPDDSAGLPVGGWVKRRDMYAASVAAFRNAHQIAADVDTVPTPVVAPVAVTPPVKRGALCVDETPDENVAPKKARGTRKENWSRDAIAKLAAVAITVIDKLFIANPKSDCLEAPDTAADPRHQNFEYVKKMAIRKYGQRCADGKSILNLDTLSNVIIHANAYVRAQREAASARLGALALRSDAKQRRTRAVFSGQIRNQLSQLIVSLWRACCQTKHFMCAKKGSDSFSPFAAGILYSLKRGLYLPDGTCIVPVLEELAAHLPALRSASSTPTARQLQSSSHRGICSIQRALTSLSQMSPEEARPVRMLLRDASRQGAFLRELVSRNS